MRQEKYVDLAHEYGIELVDGRARFVDGPALDVDGRRVEAAHYLVATGSEPDIPEIPGLRDSDYLTSTTAMELDALPASMIVLGGGYVAMEQAQLFSLTRYAGDDAGALAAGAPRGAGDRRRDP